MANSSQQFTSNRRQFLQSAGHGFGSLALAHLLADSQIEAANSSANLNGGLHHKAKVRRVIQLFMNGGVSQMDTFDHKPELEKRHGEKVDFGIKVAVTSQPGAVMKSPFPFQQHGESGRWVSSVFPQMAKHVDDLAFLMAMQSKTNVHGPASFLQNTGFLSPGFPGLGAWLSYGLGQLTDNLPAFVVLPDHRGLPYNNTGNFSAGFLPAAHTGTVINPNSSIPIPNLMPPANIKYLTQQSEDEGRLLLQTLNQSHLQTHSGDTQLNARITSLELAARMQLSAPEALDLTKETKSTHAAYGIEDKITEPFGRNCLIARRLIERDVLKFGAAWVAPVTTGIIIPTLSRNFHLLRTW